MPAIKSLCIVYVELIRGVPLISVLFMASFLFPLFMPVGKSPDVLLRVLVGITLFAAAYLAEIVRGGLQAIPRGQVEAAATLGLSYWQTQRKIVLPQALALVVPGIMNSFIAIFKDTSLVTIVSLYELTGALNLALNSDANWRPFKIEGYIFIVAGVLRVLLRDVALQPVDREALAPDGREKNEEPHRSSSFDKVNKWYGDDVPRAARHRPLGGAGRAHRDLRPVGLGQVDAHPLHQPAGGAPGRAASWSTAPSSPTT
jgi:ABC-type amino acid transport system permease subunit